MTVLRIPDIVGANLQPVRSKIGGLQNLILAPDWNCNFIVRSNTGVGIGLVRRNSRCKEVAMLQQLLQSCGKIGN
jgi:hypothetical protein